MPSRAQRERNDRRRALRQLAVAPEGMTEALMLAHGFPVPLLVDLCFAGLAIATPERWSPADDPSRSFACRSSRRGGGKWRKMLHDRAGKTVRTIPAGDRTSNGRLSSGIAPI